MFSVVPLLALMLLLSCAQDAATGVQDPGAAGIPDAESVSVSALAGQTWRRIGTENSWADDRFTFHGDGRYERKLGGLVEKGHWTATATSLELSQRQVHARPSADAVLRLQWVEGRERVEMDGVPYAMMPRSR